MSSKIFKSTTTGTAGATAEIGDAQSTNTSVGGFGNRVVTLEPDAVEQAIALADRVAIGALGALESGRQWAGDTLASATDSATRLKNPEQQTKQQSTLVYLAIAVAVVAIWRKG